VSYCYFNFYEHTYMMFYLASNTVFPTPLRRSCWLQRKRKSGDSLQSIRDARSLKPPSMSSRHGPTQKTAHGSPRFSENATSTRQGKSAGLAVVSIILCFAIIPFKYDLMRMHAGDLLFPRWHLHSDPEAPQSDNRWGLVQQRRDDYGVEMEQETCQIYIYMW
jgi:hypothetical protein